MALSEGQLVTYAIDEVIETVQNLTPMAERVSKYTPPAASMQRSGNTVWMPLEQEAPTQRGWDLTGKETDILELSVKVNLNDPDNDFFALRADDVRDETSYRRRIQASAKKLANNVEAEIARQAVEMGSLVVTSTAPIGSATSGWDFISEAESLMFARELNRDAGLSFFFNPNDYRGAGRDLAGKDFYGRIQDDAYSKGVIQKQVAGFNDVLRSPKLPSLAASTATGVTVSGAQKFKPEAWQVDVTGHRENVDNRTAVVAVSSGTGFKRGDKISFAGVKFLSQMAKNVLTQDATFSVVAVNGNNLTITPKPIALDDTSLTAEQRAYANVNTSLANNAAVTVWNTDTVSANVFWADDSIRLVSQPIPLNHDLFSGMKSQSFSVPGTGLNGVIAFQGDIDQLGGKCRIALWYAASAVRPEAIGVGLASQNVATTPSA
ncbi:P22 phage major capsid protein family protein [Cronobacter malonaticus]|uniref:Coat protein n=1 Tax=Cronobacter malonaticus TaxID=413503 RepID=A0ABX5K6D1_9ENTR|nr:P22 phage major capsid protein family protein [Cronobacter malonaticus]ALX77797.1 coat protein [Cronobacter malonaticus LMG 23826]PUX08218.1 coat protein [Cronobacter malonaticus]PUX09614.1 coat protein [Cronobacter malonaticus]CCJ92342.1 Phage capsid protein [Cronobacter malonaticus 681]